MKGPHRPQVLPGEVGGQGAVRPAVRRALPDVATMAVFCLVSVLLQWVVTGAIASDLGGYPDEPAHYVTGLLVRDYVPHATSQAPLAFATDFYARFPKVALGNWPPGLYVLLLPWFWTVGDTPASAATFVALMAGVVAWALGRCLATAVPSPVAIGGALVWLLSPLAVALGGAVMTEMALAGAMVTAVALALRGGRHVGVEHAAVFGAAVGAGILIKGSGVAALGVGPAAWRFRTTWASWAALVAVATAVAFALGGPWTLWFRETARAGWLYDSPRWAYTALAVNFYTPGLLQVLGWTTSAGVVAWLWKVRRTGLDPVDAACAAGALSTLLLLIVVPAGLELRHLLPVTLPCTALATIGAWHLIGRIGPGRVRVAAAAVLLVVCLGESARAQRPWPIKQVRGYRLAMDHAVRACPPDCRILVIADSQGEGALVADAARRRRETPVSIVRGSKLLSSSDWAGRHYTPRVRSGADGRALVAAAGIGLVIIEEGGAAYPDRALGHLLLDAGPLEEVATVPAERRVNHPGTRVAQRSALRVVRLPSGAHTGAGR